MRLTRGQSRGGDDDDDDDDDSYVSIREGELD